MKEITLRNPDKKLSFFMELYSQLGIEVSDEVTIPEEHKAIVRHRIKKSKQDPKRHLDWDKLQDGFKLE